MWLFILAFLPLNEELIYSAKFGLMTAGEIKLMYHREVRPQDNLNHIRCEEKTKGFFSMIFKIDDWYESLCDSNFATIRFEKKIQEGNYSSHQVVNIVAGRATYKNGNVVDVIEGAKDIMSLIYWLRTQELVPGDTLIVPLHYDEKNYTIKTPIVSDTVDGEPCVLLVPDLKGIKAFGGDGGLLLYYNKDKLPVLLKIKFLWGYLEAKLNRGK
ncbi:MAG: DUF3108 domain-containing protein [Candidatus Stahlbacteria bacterium]|nr:DUF3108 domain-containing protein [Candidatus Stahlbacteria bacterium]